MASLFLLGQLVARLLGLGVHLSMRSFQFLIGLSILMNFDASLLCFVWTLNCWCHNRGLDIEDVLVLESLRELIQLLLIGEGHRFLEVCLESSASAIVVRLFFLLHAPSILCFLLVFKFSLLINRAKAVLVGRH